MQLRFVMAAVLGCASVVSQLHAQTPLPDYRVRVSVRDSSGRWQVIGKLTSITPDSLTLLVPRVATPLVVNRRTVTRVEHQLADADGSFKPVAAGCLFLGGTLGLMGLGVNDPDSPGIEKAVATIGFAVGCIVGGFAGAVIAARSGPPWEEITLGPQQVNAR